MTAIVWIPAIGLLGLLIFGVLAHFRGLKSTEGQRQCGGSAIAFLVLALCFGQPAFVVDQESQPSLFVLSVICQGIGLICLCCGVLGVFSTAPQKESESEGGES